LFAYLLRYQLLCVQKYCPGVSASQLYPSWHVL
jgi:hypothetical protein